MKKQNKTQCVINTAKHKHIMTSYFVRKMPKFKDGTIRYNKSSLRVRYDIHHYINYKNILVGTWDIKRQDPLLLAEEILQKKVAIFH